MPTVSHVDPFEDRNLTECLRTPLYACVLVPKGVRHRAQQEAREPHSNSSS